jgi:hypothetical protein
MTIRLAVLAGVVALLGAACSVGGLGGGGATFGDMLALVPADAEFVLTFGDLDAHREAVNITTPAADAPDDELRTPRDAAPGR